MKKHINKLLEISGSALSPAINALSPLVLPVAGQLGLELAALLKSKNGFFAFEAALRVFPLGSSAQSIGIVEWNSNDLWRDEYKGLADSYFFFAEDIFGGQFCIANENICSFDPETGGLTVLSNSLDAWAATILDDYNLWTGHSLAHAWQEKNGPLPADFRLMPKVPFVCGGMFAVDNLIAIDAVKGMKSRGNLACQLVDLPDGAQIEFKIIE